MFLHHRFFHVFPTKGPFWSAKNSWDLPLDDLEPEAQPNWGGDACQDSGQAVVTNSSPHGPCKIGWLGEPVGLDGEVM